jgi:hypothetical protein
MKWLDARLLDRHNNLSRKRFPGPTYYEVLKWVHRIVEPSVYVEIGVRGGDSLALAPSTCRSIGIDPEPKLAKEVKAELFEMTSDAFFDSRPALDPGISLAFIDGLHTFEQTLKDFINVEARCLPSSVIMLHDCIPLDKASSTVPQKTLFYTGDVWKALLVLSECRPDLHMCIVPAWPSGIALITDLDPSSDLLGTRYAELISTYRALRFSDYARKRTVLPPLLEVSETAVEDFLSRRKAAPAH